MSRVDINRPITSPQDTLIGGLTLYTQKASSERKYARNILGGTGSIAAFGTFLEVLSTYASQYDAAILPGIIAAFYGITGIVVPISSYKKAFEYDNLANQLASAYNLDIAYQVPKNLHEDLAVITLDKYLGINYQRRIFELLDLLNVQPENQEKIMSVIAQDSTSVINVTSTSHQLHFKDLYTRYNFPQAWLPKRENQNSTDILIDTTLRDLDRMGKPIGQIGSKFKRTFTWRKTEIMATDQNEIQTVGNSAEQFALIKNPDFVVAATFEHGKSSEINFIFSPAVLTKLTGIDIK